MKEDVTNMNKKIAKLYGETLTGDEKEITGHSVVIVDTHMMITYYEREQKKLNFNSDDDDSFFSPFAQWGAEQWQKREVPLNAQNFKNWVSTHCDKMKQDMLNYVIGMVNYFDDKTQTQHWEKTWI